MRRFELSLVGLLSACSSADPAPSFSEAHGMVACGDDPGCVAYRGVGGISMGGGSAMRIALEDPGLFDVAVSLGSPYIDLEYFLHSVGQISSGGFCTMDQLIPAHLAELDQDDNPDTWCGPIHYPELALPGTDCDGFSGDFNHHYRGPPAGRGGDNFDRVGSFAVVQDFALGYGNPALYNPDSAYLPVGVPRDHHFPLSDLEAPDRDVRRRAICDDPVVVDGHYDRLYNPRGEHPVISFCDGDGDEFGVYEPDTYDYPLEVVLAVDYNGNGRRDYAEPVLSQTAELRFDFGSDGVPDADEPGYDPASRPDPSGDDYHWLDNPTGTELNLRHEEGEPFEDFGLDGVAATADFGEANGRFDQNPNAEYAFTRSPRRLIEKIADVQLSRLHIWADAGIRDFLLSAQITNQFWGALRHRASDARLYSDWADLGRVTLGSESYDPFRADLSEATIGRHGYLRYGDPSFCPGLDEATGRGNHVGSIPEATDRIATAMAFASARFPNGDFKALSGALADLGSPTGSLTDFVVTEHFESSALGRTQEYVVVLPPDYWLHPDARYPVFFFLHGQGQKATGLAGVALLLLSPQMASSDDAKIASGRSDWQKMIVVFADGQCRVGECHTGSFYLDHKGVDGNGVRAGEAFFELMRLVESRYRTKAPVAAEPF